WGHSRSWSQEGLPSLFSPVINPGPDQTNLFGRQLLDASLILRRGHVVVRITQMGHIVHEHTVGTMAGLDDLAIFPSLEGSGEAVQPQFAFGLFWPMATGASFLENRLDIPLIAYVFPVRCRRQFTNIDRGFSLFCRGADQDAKAQCGGSIQNHKSFCHKVMNWR